jgi:KDO2-lipid IV(A) lauroyltransferase
MTRIGLALMWLLHWLPIPVLAAFGRGLGRLLFRFARERRNVVLINLGLCFPEASNAEKSAMAVRHFEFFGRSFLDRALLWWAPSERIRGFAAIEGLDKLKALAGRPVILLAPHFTGIETAWARLCMELDLAGVYASQKNPLFNDALYRGRTRFGKPTVFLRKDNMRKIVKAVKDGIPLFYQPDLDFGRRESLFVPFFGVPAATVPGLSRLAQLTGAVVLPVISRMTPTGYVAEIGEPWADFPGPDVEADTRRMNAFIEAEVRRTPEQYYWVHKRFKTRPRGEKKFYSR